MSSRAEWLAIQLYIEDRYFLPQAATLCDAYHIPLSSHCAPALHVHIGCGTPALRHAEYFYDHVRIERMLFDGVAEPVEGALRPDLTRSGMGLVLKRIDAQKFAA